MCLLGLGLPCNAYHPFQTVVSNLMSVTWCRKQPSNAGRGRAVAAVRSSVKPSLTSRQLVSSTTFRQSFNDSVTVHPLDRTTKFWTYPPQSYTVLDRIQHRRRPAACCSKHTSRSILEACFSAPRLAIPRASAHWSPRESSAAILQSALLVSIRS